MKSYDTLVEALQDLKKRGYAHDFNLKDHCLACEALSLELQPEDFEIVEVYRFEGMSDPTDNSVVYAIEAADGVKGVLVDAYGPYAESITPKLAEKLHMAR